MKVKRGRGIPVFLGMYLVCTMAFFASVAGAQVAVDTSHMDRVGEFAKHWKAQLGPNNNRLSGAAQNFIHLGEQWEKIKGVAAAMSPAQRGGGPGSVESQSQSSQPQLPEVFGPASQPNLSFTRFSGAVQSETSTAWCGKAAVVGFNDSGSFWETGGFSPIGGQSFNGYSVSADGGATFTDKGFPSVGPAGTFMVGDPVLACTGPANFLYASLYEDGSVPGPSGYGYSDISLSTSTDGGNTFSAPAAAIAKDAYYHFLDKPWMTVDLANPKTIYVTYTDFDGSGTSATCGKSFRTAIELVSSIDGGTTWSAPIVVQEVCGNPFVQGSQVAVAPVTGKVYVAWESFASDFYTRELDIANSTDGGATFSAPTKVSAVDAVGDGDLFFGIQGFIRNFEFPSLTIGKGKKNTGVLYITWNDGDNRVKDAWVGFIKTVFGLGDGKYGFSDVLFTSSANGGAMWSAPVVVNKNRSNHDNYQPGVATDRAGAIAVCWYDRRRDPNNFLIDRFCGESTNGGASWTNTKLTPLNYASVVNQDLLIARNYMGDYDQITAQTTGAKTSGFLGAFVNTHRGNQNVIGRQF